MGYFNPVATTNFDFLFAVDEVLYLIMASKFLGLLLELELSITIKKPKIFKITSDLFTFLLYCSL